MNDAADSTVSDQIHREIASAGRLMALIVGLTVLGGLVIFGIAALVSALQG